MLKITEYKDFTEEFLGTVLSKFGSLTKNDYEVLIYDLMNKYSDFGNMTSFAKSVYLRVPEAKIKKLAYESEIKYHDYDRDDILRRFFKLLNESSFSADGKVIKFAIPDKYLRTAIQSELLAQGSFADGSFNSDVVAIHYKAFVLLLSRLYESNKQLTEIEKRCKSAINDEASVPFSWTAVAQHLANATADNIPDLIRKLISPSSGIDTIVGTIQSIFRFGTN